MTAAGRGSGTRPRIFLRSHTHHRYGTWNPIPGHRYHQEEKLNVHTAKPVSTNPAATGIGPWAGRPAVSSPAPQPDVVSASLPATDSIGRSYPTTDDIPVMIAFNPGRLTVKLEARHMVRSMRQQLWARSRKLALSFSAMGCYRDRKGTGKEPRPHLPYRGRQREGSSTDLVSWERKLQLAPELIDDGSPRTTSRTTCGNPSSSLAASQSEAS